MNSQKNILVVDDDALVRKTFVQALSLNNYNTDMASSGQEAIKKVKEQCFNLVLLDIKLPDILGIDLLVSIKKLQPDIIAIMITGSISTEHVVKSLNLGAFGYIHKPADINELLFKIKDGLEQQNLIRQIKTAKDEWEKTFDAIDDIIIITDKNQRITRINKATARIFGTEFKDILGLYCHELICERTTSCNYYKDMENCRDFSVRHHEVSNNRLGIQFNVTASPLFDDKDNFSGLVLIARDITEQKQMELRLQHLNKMEAIGSLSGGIAHDFNNILSPIVGFAELLLDDLPVNSISRDDASEILIAANRGKELVKQILLFSRQGEDKSVYMKIYPLVEETLKMARAMMPVSIEIRKNIEKISDFVLTAPSRIHQIVMNLCINAFHAMRKSGGVLEVNLSKIELEGSRYSKPYIRLTVKDTGHGFDKKTAERIFEPYFTTKIPGDGTGMGLSTVFGIVKSMGGTITFESEINKGTVFHVNFPCSKTQSPKKNVRLTDSVKEGSERIIIIDDDAQIIRVLNRILGGLGYKVISYENSIEALKAFEKTPDDYDLVITDLNMPKMNGAELAQKILDIRSDIPIMVCTGNQDMINKDQAFNLGIRKILPKPVSKRQIAMDIRQIFDGRKQKILIIDDDEQFRKMLRRMLERTGYSIIEAANGEEGIKMYSEQSPDLVITDMLMPIMSGTDAIYELTNKFPDIKIIAVSGGGFYDPEIVLNLAQELGAVRSLGKPINQEILLRTVKEVLE